MKKAVIYARYSAGPKQTDMSIEGQIRECKAYIKSQGYEYIDSYIDKHISGKTDKRPAFQQMVSDAEEKRFNIIVIYSLDRFSRDKYDQVLYKKKLRDLGVRVESSQEFIPEGPEGILMESMLEGFAAYYSAELARKIKRGMKERVLKGQYVGAKPPLGYIVKEDKTFAVDEKAGPIIKEAFDMYLAGASMSDIIYMINGAGLRSRRGKPFGKNAARQILSNKAYTGIYKWDDLEIEGGYPQIIDKKTFDMVQEKLKQKSKNHAPKGDFLLTGKLYCGLCGNMMTGTSGTGKAGKVYYYYKCPGKDRKNINRDYFETFIAEITKEAFSSSSELDNLADKLFAFQLEEVASEDEIGALKHELALIDNQIDKLIDLVYEDKYTDNAHNRVLKLEDQKKDLLFQIEEKELKREQIISKELIRSGIEALLSGIMFSDETTEKIIKAFVHKVTLFDDHLIIEYNFLGSDGLKTSDPVVFDQSSEWWTKPCFGRTPKLIVNKFGLFVICKVRKSGRNI